jgi:thioesterase domain-containing protein/acyl carrier protein
MIPSAFVALDAWPLTPNGKLDRRALPAPARAALATRGGHVPPRDRLELEIATTFQELLGVRPVGARDDFFELGGHSLLAVRLVAQLDRRLGVRLPLARLFGGATVEALAALLRKSPGGASVSPLVALQAGGSSPPLYFVHAIGGAAFSYLPLARALGEDQPFYAFQAQGLDGEEPPRDDVEAMAAAYLEALGSNRPRGPFWLAGWSFGGLVAHEMARRLEASGAAPEGLLLLDTWPALPGEHEPPDEAAVLALLAGELGLHIPSEPAAQGLRALRGDTLARLGAQAEAEGLLPPGLAEEYLRRVLVVHEAHLRALGRHRPGRSGMRIVIVRPEELSAPAAIRAAVDPSGGFGDFTRGPVEIHRAAGDHFSMMRPPHVSRLAEVIRGVVSGARLKIAAV